MRLSEFIGLSFTEKRPALLHLGVLVSKRRTPDYLIMLFQLDGYYVEAYCHVARKNIEGYSAITNIDQLDAYLDDISIEKLLR
ncbi:hypothetical protein EPD60_06380 [Flaviaesturariibacter flavus]|uniref:Uncharacterized protein n=1 Tax=Flaviaesturariibacter flavus TaxID=2502780 RepID=A0A4R1BKF7_9BACT|nr:hypothetical protein [Flaviaesturariibacter flavus]TCJ17806.1 hypothetical protein EPD60_06380 [Flaviaesturariibacter flavus]